MKNVLLLVSGAAGAQLIAVVLMPLITRIYSPEEFGLFGAFAAILNICTPLAALAYPMAIVLPKNENESDALAIASLAVGLAMAAIVAIGAHVVGDIVLRQFDRSLLNEYLWLLPFSIFFAAVHQVFEQYLIRKKEYITIAKVSVFQSIIINISKISIGMLHPVAATLILIQSLVFGIHSLLFLYFSKSKIIFNKIWTVSWLEMASALRRYKDFPIYRSPQVLLYYISESLPVFALAYIFEPIYAGFYVLSRAVMGVPLSLIGKSISDVFYVKITELINLNKNISREIRISTVALLFAGLPVFAIIHFYGELIFVIIFGQQWGKSGIFASWMCFWYLSALVARPVIATIPVLNLQRNFLIYEVIALLARFFVLLFAAKYFDDAVLLIAAYSMLNFIIYGLLIMGFVIILTKRVHK